MTMINIPKPARWLVYLFVAAFIAALVWHESRAAEPSPQAPSMSLFGGYTIIRGPAPVLDLDWRWPAAQSTDGQWEAGLMLIGSSSLRGVDQPSNFAPSLRYVDGFGRVDIGLGLCYLQNVDAYNGSHLDFSLMLGAHWKRWRVKYQHTSNAGTVEPNLGRDVVLIGMDL